MRIKESAENYLETIYMLSKKTKYVRSIDVANELGFSKDENPRFLSLDGYFKPCSECK